MQNCFKNNNLLRIFGLLYFIKILLFGQTTELISQIKILIVQVSNKSVSFSVVNHKNGKYEPTFFCFHQGNEAEK